MKDLRVVLWALVSALVSMTALAEGPAQVFVVPAGTAGNTPEAPYDTWATAANDVKTAATAVAKEGTVYVLGGDYSSYTKITPEQNVHVRVVASQSTEGEPGVLQVGAYLAGHAGARTDEDSRICRFDYGTIKLGKTDDTTPYAYTEYKTEGSSGVDARTAVVFSGPNTVLDSREATLTRVGYTTLGHELTFTDGARGYFKQLHAFESVNANGCRLTIANGAAVTNTSSFWFGYLSSGMAQNGVMTISNATLSATGQFLVGKSTNSKNLRLRFAGVRPFVYYTGSSSFNGTDSVFEVDLTEAPLSGYAPIALSGSKSTRALLYGGNTFKFHADARLELTGVDQLALRLKAANITAGCWRLVESTGLTISDEQIAAVNESLGTLNATLDSSSFSLARVGESLELRLVSPTAFVVPAGTPGNVPAAPYATWETAANDISSAADCLAKEGTIYVLGGDYTSVGPITAERNAHIRIMQDQDTDGPAGTMLSQYKLMGYASSCAVPDSRTCRVDYGTIKIVKSSVNQAFTEYKTAGNYGLDSRPALIFKGNNVELDSTDAGTTYLGFTAKGHEVVFTAGARGRFNTVTAFSISYANNSRLTVSDGAEMSSLAALKVANPGTNAGISNIVFTVSNATVKAASQILVGQAGLTDDVRFLLAGARPYVECVSTFTVDGTNSVFELNLAEMPLEGFAPVLTAGGKSTKAAVYSGASLKLTPLVDFVLTGLDQLVARIVSAGISQGRWSLFESKDAAGIVIDQHAIDAANATLAKASVGMSNGRVLQLVVVPNRLDLMLAPVVVYVVPENTPGNTPTPPYASWETAANVISNAAECVQAHGVVKVAEGSYQGSYSSPEQAVRVQVVKSSTDDSPGVASITEGTVIMGNKTVSNSPDTHSYTIEKGTYRMALPSDKKNVFIEYPPKGGGIEAYNKFTVKGSNTVFDCTGKIIYAIYISRHVTVHFTDHCSVLCNGWQSATATASHDGTVIIDDGAVVTSTSGTVWARGSNNLTVRIDGGEFKTTTLSYGGGIASDANPHTTRGHSVQVLNQGKLTLTAASDFAPFSDGTLESELVFDNSTFARSGYGIDIRDPGTNNTFIIRNGALLSMKSLKFGADDTPDSHFETKIANAQVVLTDAYEQRGDAKLTMDVSNLAIVRKAPAIISARTATVGSAATLALVGVDELAEKILAAEQRSMTVPLITTTDGVTLSAAQIAALGADLPAKFVIEQTANSVSLRYGEPRGTFLIMR